MNCRTCSYTLWNLVARQCPECGTPFKPSEFEFTPGSIRFLCPHCSKAYYGTAATGHLVPRSFTCVGCTRQIDMDEMALIPAQGVREADTVPIELPWTARKKRGHIRAFFQTCWWGIIRPGDVGRAVPPEGGVLTPWMYMTLVQTLIWTIQVGALLILPTLIAPGGAGLGMLFGFAITVIVMVALTVLVGVPIWAGVAHMILAGSGAVRGGFRLTFASLCYSSGANLLTAIPFMGYLFGPILWLISATVTTKEAQRVGGGRAALAVLPMPIIGVCILIAGYIGLIGWMISFATAGGATFVVNSGGVQTTSGPSRAGTVAAAMRRAALATRDTTPPHPLQLIADGAFRAQDLTAPHSQTNADTWTISGVALSEIQFLTSEQLRQLRDRLAQLPPQGQAGEFRLGDTVFVMNNAELRNIGSQLWLVVVWPDPVVNPVEDPAWPIWVGTADGAAGNVSAAEFDDALAGQNSLRAMWSLPPIRHPREIK